MKHVNHLCQLVLLLAIAVFKTTSAAAQTNPTAYDLSSGTYSFTSQTATNTTYPTNMQGWTTGTNNITAITTDAPGADFTLVASGSASTSGISNLGSSGFNFLSTSSDPNRQVGSLCLSLNSTGRNSLLVSWTADDNTSGSTRETNLTLQYRIGTSGTFTTVSSTTYTTSNSSNLASQTFNNIALPSECNNQSVVQLRWIYYESASQSGSRDAISLDEISVSSSAGAGATISTTDNSISFNTTTVGTPTADSIVQVSWSGLTANLVISAPTNFELSEDEGANYSSTITKTSASSGTPLDLWIRYNPASAAGYESGNVTLTSTGATTQNIAVSATGISTQPSGQATLSATTSIATYSATLNFGAGTGGSGRLVVVRAASAVNFTPVDGTSYTANTDFSQGTGVGPSTDNKIVYAGNSTTVNISGLSASTTYHIAVYEYNGSGTASNFLTTSAPTGNFTTLEHAIYSSGNDATSLTENMTSLANSGTSSTMPTGWFMSESGANANTTYTASSGSSNSGDTYSFGTGTGTNRALGSIRTASLAASVGFKFVNSTGSDITSLSISYYGEQWRLGATGRTDRMDFQYSTDATSLTTGTWTDLDAMDFTAPITSGTVGALDGDLNANRTSISGNITGITIANNSSIWVRWVDFDATGSDDGLGISDVVVTPFNTTRTAGNGDLGTGTYPNLNVTDTTTLTGDVTISGKIKFKDGTVVELNGNQLTLNGTVEGTAVFAGSTSGSILNIEGSGTIGTIQFDQNTPGTTNKLQDLKLDRTGSTVTIGNALNITGTIYPEAGTIASQGNITLTSDATSSARVNEIAVGADITGDVNVQRYLSGGSGMRGWRSMGVPIDGFNYTQFADDILITGPGGSTNGFDAAGSSASIMYYEENTANGRGWKSITSTSNTITPGMGLLVFFRGDRTQTSSLTDPSVVPNNVTMDFVEEINKGTSSAINLSYTNTFAASDDGWNLIGNPYPSQIDYSLINKTVNVSSGYWVWDPTTDAYISKTSTDKIASGQGFFVQVTASSQTITFEESCKASSSVTSHFKTQTNPFTIKMHRDSMKYDQAFLSFETGASKDYVFNQDAIKFKNPRVNIGYITTNNEVVQRNVVPFLNSNTSDTFNLYCTSNVSGNFWFEFTELASIETTKNIFLLDAYNNNWINVRTNPSYAFSITNSIPASFQNRFKLIVTDVYTALPVKLLSFSGSKNKQGNQLIWEVAQEKNLSGYVIEKSVDGQTFYPINIVKARNTSDLIKYQFTDKTTDKLAYYRLQIQEINSASYSSTIVIGEDNTSSVKLIVYPNPASNYFTAESALPINQISLFDVSGNLVKSIPISDLKTDIYIGDINPGVYFIKAKDLNTTKLIIKP